MKSSRGFDLFKMKKSREVVILKNGNSCVSLLEISDTHASLKDYKCYDTHEKNVQPRQG